MKKIELTVPVGFEIKKEVTLFQHLILDSEKQLQIKGGAIPWVDWSPPSDPNG